MDSFKTGSLPCKEIVDDKCCEEHVFESSVTDNEPDDVLKDEDELLRLLFDSEAYKNGNVTDEAILSRDLKERGFSLDIKKMSKIEVIKQRAQIQSAKILLKDPSSELRRIPYISTLLNSEVKSCKDEQGRILFETFHTPQPDNDAHASLYCIHKNEGRGYYVYARNQIRPLLERKVKLLSSYF